MVRTNRKQNQVFDCKLREIGYFWNVSHHSSERRSLSVEIIFFHIRSQKIGSINVFINYINKVIGISTVQVRLFKQLIKAAAILKSSDIHGTLRLKIMFLNSLKSLLNRMDSTDHLTIVISLDLLAASVLVFHVFVLTDAYTQHTRSLDKWD